MNLTYFMGKGFDVGLGIKTDCRASHWFVSLLNPLRITVLHSKKVPMALDESSRATFFMGI